MKLKIEWKRQTVQYSNGWNAFCGKFRIASTSWRGDDLPYAAYCQLPGIKNQLGYFKTEEEARERVQTAVNHWINNITIE